jgi:hypothetical protein
VFQLERQFFRFESVLVGDVQGIAEEEGLLEENYPRAAVTIFYCAHILFSLVILNVFIGMIAELYPKARQRSQLQWDVLITKLLQKDNDRRRWEMETPDEKKTWLGIPYRYNPFRKCCHSRLSKVALRKRLKMSAEPEDPVAQSASLASRFIAFEQLEKVMSHLQTLLDEANATRMLGMSEFDENGRGFMTNARRGGTLTNKKLKDAFSPKALREADDSRSVGEMSEADSIGDALDDLQSEDEDLRSSVTEADSASMVQSVANVQSPPASAAVASVLRSRRPNDYAGLGTSMGGGSGSPQPGLKKGLSLRSVSKGVLATVPTVRIDAPVKQGTPMFRTVHTGALPERPSLAQAEGTKFHLISGGESTVSGGAGGNGTPSEDGVDQRLASMQGRIQAYESAIGDLKSMMAQLLAKP